MKNKNFPNCVIPITNKDKLFHESVDMQDLGNMAHPSRIILCGNPNSGKSLAILNMLLHKKPPFQKIYLIHNDPNTKEYNAIDCEVMEELPEIDEIDTDLRNLIIIEDIEYRTLSKDQKRLLDRYFGCYSTHCNISIWITAQDAISIPASIRRMASHVFIWKSLDLNHMSILSSRFGLQNKDLKYIFDNILTDPHDSLLIDSTRPSCRFRKNIFEVLPYRQNSEKQ